MRHRVLGRSDLKTAPLIFGGNVFGWTVDEAQSFLLLDAFIEAGFDMIDTADMYSSWVPGNLGGESETIIGKWMASRGNRAAVQISSKVGMAESAGRGGLSRARIVEGIEGSLRRLRTDRIDLYQSHIDDTLTPIDETLEAHEQLIRQGKVRYIGASNYSAERLKQSLDCSQRRRAPRYETLQPLYNLHDRSSFEGALEDLCIAQDIGVITYSSLASGFLSGKYRSLADVEKSARAKALKNYCTPRGERVLQALDSVAGDYRATAAQIALAWVLARPAVTAAIVSATSVRQLHELIGSVGIRLDAAAMAKLNASGIQEQSS
ncbi:aldo/keto reductase [Bradyrhizobium sp. CCBAU 25338]|uniref:aldo/keto reductase n=1 Tax=Bradyrhizobium sp. CCBAU 25338 TaxID=1641877 RepID=UPI0023044E52|nr:aldo/keto reductase [Bradyrhizobium sp. CCBAU 25338]MDA9530243.1 alcohol dehydrogenase [Bradyrhizobium sp. CCBAU 25338]